jgi:hypothetical protein
VGVNPGRSAKGKGRNFTVNLRISQEEIDAARELGNGNISMGVRWAIRYASERKMRPVTLTTLLRSAAVLAGEMEAKRR